MKFILVLLTVLLTSSLFAQDFKLVTDEKKNEPMLVGTVTQKMLTEDTFGEWFNKSYDQHKVDEKTLESINTDFSNINILIILGTWCGDSREFVPPFLKILNKLNFPDSNLKLICVNRQKQGLADEIKNIEVKLVPLFIFYKDGKEIGRIVESPKATLEKDFVKIISESN